MSELPDGWIEITIGDVAEVNPRKSVDLEPQQQVSFVPMPAVSEVTGRIETPTDRPLEAVSKGFTQFQDGDVIVAKITPSMENGKAAVARGLTNGIGFGSTEFHVLRSFGAVDPDFLWRFVRQQDFRDLAKSVMRGAVGQQRVPPEHLREHPLPLPPLPEQRRIVAKLDGLLAGVARARKELGRVPILIAHHKQALLTAAFSGELTREWREENPDSSSRSKRQGQLASDRARLAATLPRRRSGPMVDSSGTRVPVELGTLPECWSVTTLESVTDPSRLIQYGILKPGPDVEGGVPYVKVMNILGGRIHLEKIRKTTREIHHQYRRSEIRTGDILISIRGTVGRLAFVPPELNGGNITQDSVRIAVLDSASPKYIYWYLHSPAAQTYLQRNMKGVAVRGINVGDVRPMEVPLPRLDEQQEIARQLDEAFAWLDATVAEHARAAKLLPKLEQAILAKAFRGRLVPQDPADEPAAALLARVRAQRGAQTPTQLRKTHSPKLPRAPEGKAAMTKSRFDPDVKDQPYLARLIKKEGGSADVDALFRRADLPVADFYKQLSWEISAGHVHDAGAILKAA